MASGHSQLPAYEFVSNRLNRTEVAPRGCKTTPKMNPKFFFDSLHKITFLNRN